MNNLSFIVKGEPQGKARARTFYHNQAKKICSMTPNKTVLYENLIKLEFNNQCNKFLTGPVEIEIEAYFKIPKSYSKKKRKQCIDKEIYPTKKPDIDNIIKVVADSLNGLAYKDDSCIVRGSFKKEWTCENVGYIKINLKSLN
jgi:Holliday junction resolvase RusA-like endonuclease